MIADQAVTVTEHEGLHRSVRYEYVTRGGEMSAVYESFLRWFRIDSIDVSMPRQGIGKLLLMTGLETARHSGAERIVAGIVSRECLDSMAEVFGQEYITIEQYGAYFNGHGVHVRGDDRTFASLDMPLGPKQA